MIEESLMKRFALAVALAVAAFLVSASAFALDHNHGAWDLLLTTRE